jgi:hypothetical protein
VGYIAEIRDYEVLDADVYTATVVSVTHGVEDGPYGPFLDWEFTVVSNTLTNVKVTGRSGDTFGPSTKAREWASAVLGRALVRGTLDLDTLSGLACQLLLEVVEKERGTFNRIVRVMPAKAPLAHAVNEQPSRAAFEATFAAQAAAAWDSTQRSLAPDELAPAPDTFPF